MLILHVPGIRDTEVSEACHTFLVGETDKQHHVLSTESELYTRYTVQVHPTQPGFKFSLLWRKEHRTIHKLYHILLETNGPRTGQQQSKVMNKGSEADGLGMKFWLLCLPVCNLAIWFNCLSRSFLICHLGIIVSIVSVKIKWDLH